MQSGENLIGKSIVSLTDGRVLGSVKELYLDRNLEFLTGIQVNSGEGFFNKLGSEGLFERKVEWIRREDVAVFGIDAILVKASEAVTAEERPPEAEEWLYRGALRGRKVDTPGGTKIGTIGDIIVDQHGCILGFLLSQIFVQGPVATARAIAREVLVDTGNEDGVMTIDLSKAEQQSLAAAQVGKRSSGKAG